MSRLDLDATLRPADGVLRRELDDELVLVSMSRGTCFSLDAVGARIWQLLGERARLDGVLGALTDEYEGEEARLRAEMLRLVEELLDNGLVELVPDRSK